jgi:hypothetical protein
VWAENEGENRVFSRTQSSFSKSDDLKAFKAQNITITEGCCVTSPNHSWQIILSAYVSIDSISQKVLQEKKGILPECLPNVYVVVSSSMQKKQGDEIRN